MAEQKRRSEGPREALGRKRAGVALALTSALAACGRIGFDQLGTSQGPLVEGGTPEAGLAEAAASEASPSDAGGPETSGSADAALGDGNSSGAEATTTSDGPDATFDSSPTDATEAASPESSPVDSGPALFTIGGVITGFQSGALVLQDNGGDTLTISGPATSFTFAQALPSGSPYAVTVLTNPAGLLCQVAASTGAVGSADVTTVQIVCAALTCSPTSVQAVPGTGTFHVMQNTASLSETLTVSSNDLLVVVVYSGQGPGDTTPTTSPNMTLSVSDTLGNAFFAGPMIEEPNHHESAVQIFFAPNAKAGADTVTATSAPPRGSNLDVWTGLFVQEYAGIAVQDPVDISTGQSAPTTTTTVTPGPMTTRSPCDLVVGAFTDGYVLEQTLTSGSGWPYRSTDQWCPAGAVDDVPTPAAMAIVVNPVMNLTLAADDGWAAVQMAFRASGTSGLPQPTAIGFTSSSAQTIARGACSGAVTLQSVANGVPTITSTGIAATLTASGLGLYADPQCKYPIASAVIGAGTSATTFYFSSSSPASASLQAASTAYGTAVVGETVQ